MLFGKLISPRYHLRIWKLKFEKEKIKEGLKLRSIKFIEFYEDSYDAELKVDSLLASAISEKYVYLMKFENNGNLLVISEKPLTKEGISKQDAYLVHDEATLKKLILSQNSKKSRILMEFQPLLVWSPIAFAITYLTKKVPLLTFFFAIGGYFIIKELLKILEYYLLGYCRE
ncbi:hypothetical protein E3E31_09740 [Thermococcus sp. M39]|uniref:hypothetical protein n=1 Tax=unclassified Thermococcus TaxID=2627626 RepID=UPI00143A7BE5|nr:MULTISPECIES: hypothetical protein [unclassified Thermococcus]NJE08798.1 hypothetical protein [Thermococcus sp. M39]NJE12031.1 hypothetical protein [Thermococcus sp. LS2]